MERSAKPTPDETIAAVGCGDAADIDECLLRTADFEFDKEEGDGPQDLQRAFNCLRAILMRHWDNPAPEVQKYVAGALMRRAQMLAHARQFEDARNDFAEVRARYANSGDIEVRRPVAAAFLEAGSLEEKESDPEAAADWYEEGIALFNNDRDALIEGQLIDMKINLAQIHVGREWIDLAFEIVDDCVRRWADSHIYWMRRKVAFLKVVKATAAAKRPELKEVALRLLPDSISYADQALGHFLEFIQGIAYEKWVALLHEVDRYDEAIRTADRFIALAGTALDGSDGNRLERIHEQLRNVHLVRAQSLTLLGRLDEALQACDATGVTGVGVGYKSTDEKEFAVGVLGLRVIIHSRQRQFSSAMKHMVEIYRMTGRDVDDSWTDNMVTTIGVAIENLESNLKKAGMTLDEVTTRADGSPDPS